jgi:nucleobase:cation symporter-1, NCS1 family
MLSQSATNKRPPSEMWPFFVAAVTANVGFWSTLSLNIPDFTRFARSQKAQVVGQAVGLPPSMALFAFIGVAVTSATIVIYGEAIWDPIVVVTKFKNPVVLVVALLSLCLATLATNIAANVVSPANDFANLWPKRITFFIGGLITGLIGIAMHPWKLIAHPSGYIFNWLIAYSSLLGAVGGIMVVDYFAIRRRKLDLDGLYLPRSRYWYAGGFNPAAIVAFVCGIAPCGPGFLKQVGLVSNVPAFWVNLYNYAWFLSFAIAGAVYWTLMSATRRESSAA